MAYLKFLSFITPINHAFQSRSVAQTECYPYDSGVTQTKGSCRTPRRSRRPHELTCSNGTRVTLGKRDLIGMQPPYRIASKEQDIMHELYNSGPVQGE